MSRSPISAVSAATQKKVITRAQGHCQYWYDRHSRCGVNLVPPSRSRRHRVTNLGAVAHIYSPMINGPRHMNEGEGIDDLNREWNLLLMCPEHHKEIDDYWPSYPPELLLEWKTRRSVMLGLIDPDDIDLETLSTADDDVLK